MKRIIVTVFAVAFGMQHSLAQLETFHDFSAVTITGDTISMSQYSGQKVMVVNVATFCGFTNQYSGLVTLDSLYGSAYNFVILGFPCNDFGAQEPFDDSTIAAFASNVYNVKFQMMHKISISAVDTLELYKWLQLQNRNGVANAPVTWNFNKFLINEQGQWIAHHPEATAPLDTAITNWITSSPTAITELGTSSSVKLFSNNVANTISILIDAKRAENFLVELFDVSGKKIVDVFSGNVTGIHTVTYNATSISRGIYFLKVTSTGFAKTFKVAVGN